MKRSGATRIASRLGLATAVMAVMAVGGCSSTDEFFSGRPDPTESSSSSSGFADRFRSLFGSGSEATTSRQPTKPETGDSGSTSLDDCPPVSVRHGAQTLQTNAPGSDQALALRYQAGFGRTARQCTVTAGTLSIKVGVQGRVILGPAGAPGEATIPLRYALVKEGIEPRTIWSKLYILPVTIPPGQPNVPFTHVAEDMAVPMPPQAEFDQYVIYVGFDPQGAELEKRRPQPAVRKPKPKQG